MPPTVKSLEERIDDIADDVGEMRTQLAVVTAKLDLVATGLNQTQAQLATLATALTQTNQNLGILVVRLDTAIADIAKTNVRIDATNTRIEVGLEATNRRIDAGVEATTAKIDAVEVKFNAFLQEFADFRGRAGVVFNLLKWVGVTTTGLLAAAVTAAFALNSTITTIQNRLDTQQKTLDEIHTKLK